MSKETWIVLRACWPGLVWLGIGVLSAGVGSGLAASPYSASLFDNLRWIPVGLFGLSVVSFASAGYRLWQWDRAGPACNHCGGPLGHEREGIRGRGNYRRCLACGINVNQRHYH